MQYVTGETIKTLREKKKLTQKEIGALICVNDKTISKWETIRGLPDISILTELASALNVSVAELLTGDCAVNQNRSSNMKKLYFTYVLYVGILYNQSEQEHSAAAEYVYRSLNRNHQKVIII